MARATRYPVPSAPAEQNEAARADEDKSLVRFVGLAAFDRNQVAELVGRKFGRMAHRKAPALQASAHDAGGPRQVPGAASVVRRALASSDDYQVRTASPRGPR